MKEKKVLLHRSRINAAVSSIINCIIKTCSNPYTRQNVSVFSVDGDRWKTQRHLRRKTVRGKYTRQRAKSESCKEKTQMLKSIYRTLLWRSTLQNDRYSVRSSFQNGLFCLFLPFVGKGAKNTKGQMLQQLNHYGYWLYLCFIYLGRTAADSANTKEVIFQSGRF